MRQTSNQNIPLRLNLNDMASQTESDTSEDGVETGGVTDERRDEKDTQTDL